MDLMPGREKLEVVPVQPLCRRRVTNLRLALNSSEMFGPRIQAAGLFSESPADIRELSPVKTVLLSLLLMKFLKGCK